MEVMKKNVTAAQTVRCDLHTHSVFSDGTDTPTALITAAKREGLIVALSDHNTVAGLPEFMEAARAMDVTAVPGIEFSTEHGGRELHLLGLFVMPEHYTAVERIVKEQQVLKEICNMEVVERLNQAGYAISYADIKRRNPSGNINRVHMAAELLEKGYISSIKEAFDTILGENGGFYLPPERPQVTEVIADLRRIGVLPVLAHPLKDLTEQELRAILPALVAAGLMGMETMYGTYTPETTAIAAAIAAEHGLLSSGGSDYHGTAKPDIALGTGRGGLAIPLSVYEDLLAARQRI